jgi:hypothetical protein
MPEKATVNLSQRQHALNPTLAFSVKKPCLMPECALNDGLPSGAVKKSRFGAERHELFPSFHLTWLK